MNRWFLILPFLFSANVFAENPLLKGKEYVADELIVKYKATTSDAVQSDSITKKHGARRLRKLRFKNWNHIKVSKGKSLEKAISELQADPNVELVQPNYIYKATALPNDTYFTRQWSLKNTGQTVSGTGLGGPDAASNSLNPGTSGFDMKLEKAWDTITDCSSVTVAVLDTGVNYNHIDLATNMWDGSGAGYPNHGYDFVSVDNDPMDQHGHGTHVAGSIGAVGNNGAGVAGVCWKSSIMAVRVLDQNGSGTTTAITDGIDFAVAHGAKIINMSLGGGGFDALQSTAITNAQNAGVLLVVAAGNSHADVEAAPTYPCSYSQTNILCIAALSQDFSLASYSNYGSTSVDMGAPGTNVVSTWPGTEGSTAVDLTVGWTTNSTTATVFGSQACSVLGNATNCLVAPSTYDGSTAKYNNSTDTRVYRTFNLAAYARASFNFYIKVDTESSKDYFRWYGSSTAGDPIAGGTSFGYNVSGSSDGDYLEASGYDLTPYISANTTIGYRLTSDATNNDFGVSLGFMFIDHLTLNNTTYNVISGTSMATPNAAGVAAMIWAYNPNYTLSDVITSLKSGGTTLSSLNTKTTTGKYVNATNSLAFIQAPTGGAAAKVP